MSNQKKVAILVDNGFEEVELSSPKQYLEEKGLHVDIISPQSKNVKSWDFNDWGKDYTVDIDLSKAVASDYDALILPGGVINPDSLRINDAANKFINDFIQTKRPIASICHGPWTLIKSGFVKGKNITSYQSIADDLRNAGANWTDQEVVVDGNLVTSRTPDDLDVFNKTFYEVLNK